MVALAVCICSLHRDLDTPGAADRLSKYNAVHTLREVGKVWGHLWDKRFRIFTPVVARKIIEPVRCNSNAGGKMSVIEGISDCVLWVAKFLVAVTP